MRPAVLQPVLVSSVLLASRYLALSERTGMVCLVLYPLLTFTFHCHGPTVQCLKLLKTGRRNTQDASFKGQPGCQENGRSVLGLPLDQPTACPDVFRNLNLHECAQFFVWNSVQLSKPCRSKECCEPLCSSHKCSSGWVADASKEGDLWSRF